jgi:predicted ABC-type ATPase
VNIGRVNVRVAMGGHSVPSDRIISRYEKCIKQFPQALKLADEAIVYDNSGDAPVVILSKENAIYRKIQDGLLPNWASRVLGLSTFTQRTIRLLTAMKLHGLHESDLNVS